MLQFLSIVLSSTTRVDYNEAVPVSRVLSSPTRVGYNVTVPVSCFVIDN